MRLTAGVPPNHWDEFIVTANYLHMLVPTKSLKNITPFEAYHLRKPDISHLREIGCKAFVLILNKHNPKVFQQSEECVLIGYETNSKIYRCYHHATHKVIESYHVVFIESKDQHEVPFCPGVTQGLDEEPLSPDTPPTPTSIIPTPTIPTPIPPAPVIPSPPIPQSAPQVRRTTCIPITSSCSAETYSTNKISAVQKATFDSIASKE
jgi:hypothetical protein